MLVVSILNIHHSKLCGYIRCPTCSKVLHYGVNFCCDRTNDWPTLRCWSSPYWCRRTLTTTLRQQEVLGTIKAPVYYIIKLFFFNLSRDQEFGQTKTFQNGPKLLKIGPNLSPLSWFFRWKAAFASKKVWCSFIETEKAMPFWFLFTLDALSIFLVFG